VLEILGNQSGLLGISGLSGDVRDLEQAASEGHARADLALKVFTQSIKQYIGAYLAVLGGADAIVFTGGIGENSVRVRRDSLAGLQFAGIRLDGERNSAARGEARISADDSAVQIWTVPTNEELIVARQTGAAIRGR
jgi:acetate kinase